MADIQESTFPPNTPDGAKNLGAIDEIAAVNTNTILMACRLLDFDIKWGSQHFDSKYFSFRKIYDWTYVDIQMIEHPSTSMWFNLYNANHIFLEEIRGASNERLYKMLPSGNYYLQSLTDQHQNRLPDGVNSARLIARFSPTQTELPEPAQSNILFSPNIHRLSNLYIKNGRLTTEKNQTIPYGRLINAPDSTIEEEKREKVVDVCILQNIQPGIYDFHVNRIRGIRWSRPLTFAIVRNFTIENLGERGNFEIFTAQDLTIIIGDNTNPIISDIIDEYIEFEAIINKR